MRWMAHRARWMSRRARVLGLLTFLATAVAYGAVQLIPPNVGAAAAIRDTASQTQSQSAATSTSGEPFGGVPAVGALFTSSGGTLGTHFCTASVVHSADGDLAVTAAHCLEGTTGTVVFVPGYVNGKEPYGVWRVTAAYTDQAWQSAQNPDDDVAFLRLSDSSSGKPVEAVTGAERFGTSPTKPTVVRVIGYPDQTDQPISCVNWARDFSATQLEFDCANYTDGTSGSPFIAGSSSSGHGTVVGVIGGYEQGGDTPDVSYASDFGKAVTALYKQVAAAS